MKILNNFLGYIYVAYVVISVSLFSDPILILKATQDPFRSWVRNIAKIKLFVFPWYWKHIKNLEFKGD